MKQGIHLLRFTVNGIKNIEHEVNLDFYKRTIDRNFVPDRSRVKAIYGENGSGKTGLVLAVQIMKNLLLYGRYLADSANQNFLKEVINKNIHQLQLECEYYVKYTEKNKKEVAFIYKYIIQLSQDRSDAYKITKEQLLKKNGMYATSRYKEVFLNEAQELSLNDANKQIKQTMDGITANLLSYRTLGTIMLDHHDNKEIRRSELWKDLMTLHLFAWSVITSFDDSDVQNLSFIRESYKILWEESDDHKVTGNVYPRIDIFNGHNRIIAKNEIKEYEKEVKKLERFIQLFKNDLKCIDIDKKETRESYECQLIMNYGTYRVSTKYESSGINKLIKLFDYLSFAMEGKIVFIDEMDSNINDVYLCKIIEFFVRYGEGQLCFTTHNTSPMSVLRKQKYSIDFLSANNKIIQWKTNGNFSPENLYRNGMIEYLPFNIEAEDFIGILGD